MHAKDIAPDMLPGRFAARDMEFTIDTIHYVNDRPVITYSDLSFNEGKLPNVAKGTFAARDEDDFVALPVQDALEGI